MTTTLKLQIDTISGSEPMPFPGGKDGQACLADYKYSASRMSSAPNITATLKWHKCLDKEWSQKVFVLYNEERYFVKNTPSSSYDNTSRMYSHSLELVSERAILDSIYFVDISTKQSEDGENPQGDSLSDNSEFSFSGDINEFVVRLNKSLEKSGVGGESGYEAVVDSDIESESKLFEVSNQYVTDALKAAYELYEVPYYFVGKKIHFGNQHVDILTPLEYGADNQLLSISKSNENKQVITKITGTGSERNIQYYYPNPTPKGRLKLGGESKDYYEISNQLTFSENMALDKPFHYKSAFGSLSDGIDITTEENEFNEISVTGLSEAVREFKAVNNIYKFEFSIRSSTNQFPSFIPVTLQMPSGGKYATAKWNDYFISGYATDRTGKEHEIAPSGDNSYIFLEFINPSQPRLDAFIFTLYLSLPNSYVRFSTYSGGYDIISFTDFNAYQAEVLMVESSLTITASDKKKARVYVNPVIYVDNSKIDDPLSLFKNGEVYSGDNRVSYAYIADGSIYLGNLSAGQYKVKMTYTMPSTIGTSQCRVSYNSITSYYWEMGSNGDFVDFDKIGVKPIAGYSPAVGDTIMQEIDYRIDVKPTLMPSEYRRTFGKNRWYLATNASDRGKWYGNIDFENEHDSDHPVEYIYSTDDIYPSIKNAKNKAGQKIDTFIEIAFDQFDNNEVYAEGEERAGEYVHPYFFAKLKKTGDFNLFDSAIESEEMKISFTSGHVAGCEFVIGVDEDGKNPVQVDPITGELVRLYTEEQYGDVLCGRPGQDKPQPQDFQQDTREREVWIALRKDDSTMGVLMPDISGGLAPKGDIHNYVNNGDGSGDTFVILGIQLPEEYIKDAEALLEQEILKYLSENNSEKFSFSLKLSSIYLAEHPEFAKDLTENSRVRLVYDGVTYTMFVNSYSLSVKESSALPEVTITINDEIKVAKKKNKDAYSLITEANLKLVRFEKLTNTISAQILSTNAQSKEILSRLIIVEDNIGDVDIQNLNKLVNTHNRLITTTAQKLNIITNRLEGLDDRMTDVEQKVTIVVIAPDENNS